MEILDDNVKTNNLLEITNEVKGFLLEIAKWSKFLSIIGFIGIGILILVALFFMTVGASLGAFAYLGIGTGIISFIYLVIAVLYFFPVYYLYNASRDIKQGILSANLNLLTAGFSNLKSHYKFIGIMMIVLLSIYALVFLGGILTAILSGLL